MFSFCNPLLSSVVCYCLSIADMGEISRGVIKYILFCFGEDLLSAVERGGGDEFGEGLGFQGTGLMDELEESCGVLRGTQVDADISLRFCGFHVVSVSEYMRSCK